MAHLLQLGCLFTSIPIHQKKKIVVRVFIRTIKTNRTKGAPLSSPVMINGQISLCSETNGNSAWCCNVLDASSLTERWTTTEYDMRICLRTEVFERLIQH